MTDGVAPALDRIVIGIDFGAPSLAAAAWIAHALAPAGELMLVHVIGAPPPLSLGEPRPAPTEEAIHAAREVAGSRLRDVAATLGDRPVRVEVRDGPPAPGIAAAAEAWGADLVAVGPHEARRPPWSAIGSTAEHLIRMSPIPVLLVTGSASGPPRRLLVPVDDGDLSAAVLEWAGAIARCFGAGITLAHVIDARSGERRAPGLADASRSSADATGDEPAAAPPEVVAKEWLARLARELPGARPAELAVSAGVPGEEVLATALRAGADLIIMGRRGRGRVLPGEVGSTARTVLRGASCPVLIVVDPADAIVGEWPAEAADAIAPPHDAEPWSARPPAA
ncbi:MAG TPA: universal stress protein [Gemmatimonadaceae bacterium]